MKILAGEEARKVIDGIAEKRALPDEVMENVVGGYKRHPDYIDFKNREIKVISMSEEEMECCEEEIDYFCERGLIKSCGSIFITTESEIVMYFLELKLKQNGYKRE